jgi:hypothetical protein
VVPDDGPASSIGGGLDEATAPPTSGSLGLSAADRERLLRAVDFLARCEGEQAPLPAFATATGSLLARAAGLVSRLSSQLNVDGYQLLTHDPLTDLVRLDVATLKILYGAE